MTRTPRTRRARRERGAALVEFAIVGPILFLSMFVLADFALAELSDSAGSNAAREGARIGILHYDGAHIPGSPNNTEIVDAVTAKLAGNVRGTPTVVVRCLEENGTARSGGGSCSTVGANIVEIGEDLIEVRVTWTRKGGITGFIDPTRTDRSQMRIVGTPPAGAPAPTTCSMTASSATPASAARTGSTIQNVTFDVTVSDASLCGTPLIALPAGSGYVGSQTMVPTGGNTFAFTMDGSMGTWTSGSKTATTSANGGAVTQDITFTVLDPAVCQITSATASPAAVTHTNGTLSSAVTFTVVVSDAVVCGTPTLTFPANAGFPSPRTTAASGPNTFTFTLPTTQGAGSWTAQTYTIVSTAPNGGGDTENASLVVSSAPTCALSNLTPNPATLTIKKNTTDEIDRDVTFQVMKTAACGNNLTIRLTPGPSGTGSGDLTIAKSMTCGATSCIYTVRDKAKGWNATPSQRVVTMTDPNSGATISGNVNMVQDT